jgi:hypothetical protein
MDMLGNNIDLLGASSLLGQVGTPRHSAQPRSIPREWPAMQSGSAASKYIFLEN